MIMRLLLSAGLSLIPLLSAPADDYGPAPVQAPFEKLDSLCVNEW